MGLAIHHKPSPPNQAMHPAGRAGALRSPAYPELDDVIGISICDFELWPRKEAPHVPMLSRWRMQEQASGVVDLPEPQLLFLELPRYAGGTTRRPSSTSGRTSSGRRGTR